MKVKIDSLAALMIIYGKQLSYDEFVELYPKIWLEGYNATATEFHLNEVLKDDQTFFDQTNRMVSVMVPLFDKLTIVYADGSESPEFCQGSLPDGIIDGLILAMVAKKSRTVNDLHQLPFEEFDISWSIMTLLRAEKLKLTGGVLSKGKYRKR